MFVHQGLEWGMLRRLINLVMVVIASVAVWAAIIFLGFQLLS